MSEFESRICVGAFIMMGFGCTDQEHQNLKSKNEHITSNRMSWYQFVSERNSNFLSFLAFCVGGRAHLGQAEEVPLDGERGLRMGSEYHEAVGLIEEGCVVVLRTGDQKSGTRHGSDGFVAPRLVHFMRFRVLMRTESTGSSFVGS